MKGAPRGRQHRGRSTAFRPDRPVRASVNLEPGDPDRALYERLVVEMGISGAEVLRHALRSLAQARDTGALKGRAANEPEEEALKAS